MRYRYKVIPVDTDFFMFLGAKKRGPLPLSGEGNSWRQGSLLGSTPLGGKKWQWRSCGLGYGAHSDPGAPFVGRL